MRLSVGGEWDEHLTRKASGVRSSTEEQEVKDFLKLL